ncbi:hypothetical protein, partial [Geminocystis sp. GBBB08]|uniref:hypothetical protein n=1 Tax=Geminocystis sp. GBBB08 TaxID=2604140 RepID=UPI0027E397FC
LLKKPQFNSIFSYYTADDKETCFLFFIIVENTLIFSSLSKVQLVSSNLLLMLLTSLFTNDLRLLYNSI